MTNLTEQELAEAVAKIAELDAKRTQGEWKANESNGTGDLFISASDGTYIAEIGAPEEICVEYDHAFIAQAPLMAKVIRQLWEEREQREKQLRTALHPNGVKHPQQSEWVWLVEEASTMQKRLDELEAHHCEAPRNKRITELEKECAALAAHQCHKPYADEYGNMRCEYQKTIEQQRTVMEQARDGLESIREACINSVGAPETQVREYAFDASCRTLAALDAALGRV